MNNMGCNAPPPGYHEIMLQENYDENYNQSKYLKIKNLIEKYEIAPLFSEKLEILKDFEIVLLLDDSGSMNTPLNDGSTHMTRWDELKSVVNIVISITSIYDSDGIDIYFLNRRNYSNVKSLDEVSTILDNPPQGLTPLTRCLDTIFSDYNNSLKPVLVIIATDGVPYNGVCDLHNFKNLLKNRNYNKFYISFLACSDQESDIGYLNDLDKNIPNVDTLDDYHSERKEVLSVQGTHFSYTFGDHVVRLLLGPICSELDKLDEINISNNRNKKKGTKCNCVLL